MKFNQELYGQVTAYMGMLMSIKDFRAGVDICTTKDWFSFYPLLF